MMATSRVGDGRRRLMRYRTKMDRGVNDLFIIRSYVGPETGSAATGVWTVSAGAGLGAKSHGDDRDRDIFNRTNKDEDRGEPN
jgi:hypothetical protein